MKSHTIAVSERDVKEMVQEYLVSTGHSILGTVKVKGSVPDIVASKDDRIVMIEVKGGMGNIHSGIARAIDHSAGSHYSYLALPSSRSSDRIRSIIKGLGLGLMEVDNEVHLSVNAELRTPRISVLTRSQSAANKREDGTNRKYMRHTTLAKISKHKEVVMLLLEYPSRSFTIRELAKLSNKPYSTVWRFIEDLYSAGVVMKERIGQAVACKLNSSTPFLEEVKKVLDIRTSPHRMAAEFFTKKTKELKGVRRIILFGSVARGEESLKSDVDLAVFIDDRKLGSRIASIAGSTLDRTGIRVIPLIMSSKEEISGSEFKEELDRGVVMYEGAS